MQALQPDQDGGGGPARCGLDIGRSGWSCRHDGWRHEIKWDGYRVCLVISAGVARVRTRRGLDWTDRFPGIAASAAKLACRNAIIDGEAVVLDAKGRPDFAALQSDLAAGGKDALAYVFDLLFLDGRDLRRLPLSERCKALETLIVGARARSF